MALLRQLRTPLRPVRRRPDSLFIACPSYEGRSTALVQQLSEDYRVDRAVLFQSKEYRKKGLIYRYERTCIDKKYLEDKNRNFTASI